MKKIVTVISITLAVFCLAAKGTTMEDVFSAITYHERTVQSENVIMNGNQYIVLMGFYHGDTALLTSDDVIVLIEGEWIIPWGQQINITNSKKVKIGSKKYKIVKVLPIS